MSHYFALWVTPIRGDFLFVHMWSVMNDSFYLLLTGGWEEVCDFLWDFSKPVHSLVGQNHPLLPHFWLSVLHKCSRIPWALMHWPLRLHIISTQWSLSPESAAQPPLGARTHTHTAGLLAYSETQITLFYYLPARIIYGVITELHNEPGWLFKF